jgi:HEAT repeat protein
VGLGLGAPNTLLKKSLINRLYQTYDPRAVAYLVEFLGDNNPEIVAHAAFGLGTLKAREHLPELLNLLHHPAEVVRNLSAHAIGAIVSPNDELVLQPLLGLLNDEADLVRIAAIAALGQLRKSQAVLPLVHLLEDRNSGIRYQVIQTLGKIGDVRALEALQNRRRKALPDEVEVRLVDRAMHFINRTVATDETG